MNNQLPILSRLQASFRSQNTIKVTSDVHRFHKCKKEQGAALVVALIVLVVITVLGVGSMKSSLMNLSSAQGFSDYDYAFQSAETGLRFAESILEEATSESDASARLAAANISTVDSDSGDYNNDSFWDAIAFYNTRHQVKIVVEHYQTVLDSLDASGSGSAVLYYKVTARGVDPEYAASVNSGSEDLVQAYSVTVLQSIYAKRYSD